MLGKVWLLNVWASWCVSCREEHPVLVEFAKTGMVPIYVWTTRTRATRRSSGWTGWGNPYQASLFDPDGRVGIDYGVYGVPETYVIDRNRGRSATSRSGRSPPEIPARQDRSTARKLNA